MSLVWRNVCILTIIYTDSMFEIIVLAFGLGRWNYF